MWKTAINWEFCCLLGYRVPKCPEMNKKVNISLYFGSNPYSELHEPINIHFIYTIITHLQIKNNRYL